MAKTFSTIKKSLNLTDFITFGKYVNCRVDSIIDMDDDYLRFMVTKGIKFDKSVIDALSVKFSADSMEVGYDPRDQQEEDEVYKSIRFEDVPF